jgi:hypothetical protein
VRRRVFEVFEMNDLQLNGAGDHRRKVQQDVAERAALRDSELESQVSPIKNPQERIGIWERLHALRLPKAPGHVLVKVIAKQTRLTVSQVHEEQQRRAGTLVQAEPAEPVQRSEL